MSTELYDRNLAQLVELVRTSLRAGHVPPDPETRDEYEALKREFPEESWRWDPPVDVGVRLLDHIPPPFGEDWEGKFLSTVLANPSRYGRVFSHVMSKSKQESDT